MSNRITVMDVFSLMGIVPDREVSWSVGSRMAAMYAEEFGEQPPKDNRPKTSGGGSHCFALYPPNWQRRIQEVISEYDAAKKSQFSLFDEAAT